MAACACAAMPAEACRLALVMALDVSQSVDDAEDALQRRGLAAALLSQPVQDAFFASPDPVAIQIFEWSGRSHQTDLIDWTLIRTPADLSQIADWLQRSLRQARGLPTAMGHALAHASISLDDAPACLFQTIDIAGDGANNDGFSPAGVYATFPFDGVTVNGLVVTSASPEAAPYFASQVIRGPLSFVQEARDYRDFADAMQQKLIRELSAQIIGQSDAQAGDQG